MGTGEVHSVVVVGLSPYCIFPLNDCTKNGAREARGARTEEGGNKGGRRGRKGRRAGKFADSIDSVGPVGSTEAQMLRLRLRLVSMLRLESFIFLVFLIFWGRYA